jgi:glycosyltransferase involved in cell wall biosynthesis
MGLKILFLSHAFYPVLGGIEVNSEILAQFFWEAGHNVHLLTWSMDPTGREFPYKVIRAPNKRKLFQEHAWADVVFENNPCLRLAWPSLFYRNVSVIALNTWVSRIDGTTGFPDRIKLAWLQRANDVIAVSDALRKRCWSDAIVIGNPYRINDFELVLDVPRSKDFVFLGRLVSDKGADHAIWAIHQLVEIAKHNGSPTPSLTIIGDGPERNKLAHLVSSLELENAVSFTGSLRGRELTACLNRHRFLLVPSLWEEPFGNVVLEGLACGCVPIVSNGGGLPEAVGKAGLIFKRGSVEALVASIQHVLSSPQLERELRASAPNHLAAFHPAVVAQRYLDVIQAAFDEKH